VFEGEIEKSILRIGGILFRQASSNTKERNFEE
jgi:hypothetical protein